MMVFDAIRELSARSGISLRAISIGLGHHRAWLSHKASTLGDVHVSTLADVARACGHRLCLVPFADVPPSAITVSGAEEMIG